MPKSVMPSGALAKLLKREKAQESGSVGKTPRLKCFFSSKAFKQQR